MKRILEVIKKEVKKNWRSELDLCGIIVGITTVGKGRDYYIIECEEYKLEIRTSKNRIRIHFVDYDELEERQFVVSREMYDRFSEKVEKIVTDTEEERFIKRYARKYGINIDIDKK